MITLFHDYIRELLVYKEHDVSIVFWSVNFI